MATVDITEQLEDAGTALDLLSALASAADEYLTHQHSPLSGRALRHIHNVLEDGLAEINGACTKAQHPSPPMPVMATRRPCGDHGGAV